MKNVLFGFILILSIPMLAVAEDTKTENFPGLAAGVSAPDFSSTTSNGETIRLSDVYRTGPVVLIFYRGAWCPYCNLQLQSYQKHLEEFKQQGASIIAISVDRPQKAAETVAGEQLGFTVVSDPEAKVLELYNAVYQVPEELRRKYKDEYKIDLQAHSGRDDGVIAVPATYVIDRAGRIIFAHSDIDYKVRKSPEEILSVLKSMPDGS